MKAILRIVLDDVGITMLDLVGYAGKLEEHGLNQEGEGLREIAGQLDNWCYNVEQKHKKRSIYQRRIANEQN